MAQGIMVLIGLILSSKQILTSAFQDSKSSCNPDPDLAVGPVKYITAAYTLPMAFGDTSISFGWVIQI
jgi:hypothetical protein